MREKKTQEYILLREQILKSISNKSDLLYYINEYCITIKGILNKNLNKIVDDNFKILIKSCNTNLVSDCLPEQIYWLINNIKDYKKCIFCEKNVTTFVNFKKGYTKKYCSMNCSNNDKNRTEKAKQTMLLKYGVENTSQLEINRKKQSERMKNDPKGAIDKKYMMEKYGVAYSMQIEEVKQRVIKNRKKRSRKKSKKEIFIEAFYSNIDTLDGVKYFITNNCCGKNKDHLNKAINSMFDNDMIKKVDKYIHPNLNTENIVEKFYWILNDMIDYPKCKSCGDIITTFKDMKSNYVNSYCSKICANTSEERNYKVFISSIKTKEYIMPSGKHVKIQGYEDRALDELLQYYREEDLIVSRKEIPSFCYFLNNKKHKYFPDIYIPKENLIIEVKSAWTLQKELEKNNEKFKSVVDNGFNLDVMVYTEKSYRSELYYGFK